MDYTQLIKRLTQGDLVAIVDSENQVTGYKTNPPTRDSLAAARALAKLSGQVQMDMQYIATLTKERDEALDEIIKLKMNPNKEIENADNS